MFRSSFHAKTGKNVEAVFFGMASFDRQCQQKSAPATATSGDSPNLLKVVDAALFRECGFLFRVVFNYLKKQKQKKKL